jgi:hypothetical protein
LVKEDKVNYSGFFKIRGEDKISNSLSLIVKTDGKTVIAEWDSDDVTEIIEYLVDRRIDLHKVEYAQYAIDTYLLAHWVEKGYDIDPDDFKMLGITATHMYPVNSTYEVVETVDVVGRKYNFGFQRNDVEYCYGVADNRTYGNPVEYIERAKKEYTERSINGEVFN